MTKQNIIEKCEGTEIQWKEGKNVTEKKVKKKSKNKKSGASKTVNKVVECESFFNYFKTIEMPDEKDLKEGDEDEEEKNLGDKMDEDFDLGNEFKDQLIPLALEYYMEVIEDDEDGDCDSCDDDHHHHDKDSDEDDQPKGGKGKKKGGNKKEAEGADK